MRQLCSNRSNCPAICTLFFLCLGTVLLLAVTPNVSYAAWLKLTVTHQKSGDPIPDAHVTVYQGHDAIKKSKTNGKGVSLIPLAQGTYKLNVAQKGFKQADKTVVIGNDHQTSISVKLYPAKH